MATKTSTATITEIYYPKTAKTSTITATKTSTTTSIATKTTTIYAGSTPTVSCETIPPNTVGNSRKEMNSRQPQTDSTRPTMTDNEDNQPEAKVSSSIDMEQAVSDTGSSEGISSTLLVVMVLLIVLIVIVITIG